MKSLQVLGLSAFAILLGACASVEAPEQVPPQPAFVTKTCYGDVVGVYERARSAITGRGLTIFNEINHTENALGVGVSLQSTQLIIFGNPKIGSALIAADRGMGFELPMRMLIWMEEGRINVSVTNIDRFRDTYALSGQESRLEKAQSVLAAIQSEACG